MARKRGRSIRRRVSRRFGRRRGGSRAPKNVALGPTIGIAAAVVAPGVYALNQGGTGTQMLTNYFRGLTYNTTGYDPVANAWGTSGLRNFYGPIAVGGIAHIIANKSGLNRVLARNRFGVVV